MRPTSAEYTSQWYKHVISPAEAVSEWHQRRTQGPRSAAILNLRVSPGFEVATTRVLLRIQDGVKKVNLGSIHFAVQYSAQGIKYKAFSFQSNATIQTYSFVWPLTFKREEDFWGISWESYAAGALTDFESDESSLLVSKHCCDR